MAMMTLQDGGKMAYVDRGCGRPLLFLHGWGTGSAFFHKQLQHLESDFRVIAPDFRGHGASSPLPEDGDIHTLARDLGAFLDHLDLQDVIVCGWSMGSMVLWDFLATVGCDRISQYVVVDMTPKISNDKGWGLGLLYPARRYSDIRGGEEGRSNWDRTCESFLSKLAPKGSDPVVAEWELKEARRCDPASMFRLWNSLVSEDYREEVSSLGIPALLIYGEQSQLYGPETSAWLDAHLPQSSKIAFKRSGHAPHLDEAERFNSEIVVFANREGLAKAPCDASFGHAS